MELSVQIVRFVKEHQPSIVACDFKDAEGNVHITIDKVPIFTSDLLTRDSRYPHPGRIRCEVLDRWRDTSGRELARITTDKPDRVESTKGISQFVVLSSHLSDSSGNPQ
jgi:hypothetical protein